MYNRLVFRSASCSFCCLSVQKVVRSDVCLFSQLSVLLFVCSNSCPFCLSVQPVVRSDQPVGSSISCLSDQLSMHCVSCPLGSWLWGRCPGSICTCPEHVAVISDIAHCCTSCSSCISLCDYRVSRDYYIYFYNYFMVVKQRR